MNMRRLFALLHGWLGAVSALFVLIVALSGAALAFVDEMFLAQYGDILRAESPSRQAEPLGLESLIAGAKAGYGEFLPTGALMPHSRIADAETALVFGMPPGAQSVDDLHMFSVDPWTGAFKGDFPLRSAFGHEFIEFHYSLLLGPSGAVFVCVIGMLLLAFIATGLWLWWPRNGSAWRKATRLNLRGGIAQALFAVHGLGGVWLAVLILFFTFTGVGLRQPNWFGPLLSATQYAPPPSAGFERACEGSISPDAAIAAAVAATPVPGRSLATAYVPNELSNASNMYMLTLRAAGDRNLIEGDARVFVHASCEGLVHVDDARAAAPPARVTSMLLSLHGGYSFGPYLGDLLVLVTGLGLAVLSASGIVVFLTRTLRIPLRFGDAAKLRSSESA